MGKKITGRTISLSPHRRLVNELLVHAKRVPSNPIERDCQISEIAELREQLRVAPSWQAIFIKAFGIVNQRFPELRRAWIPFPYARIYEHPHCEVAVLVEREWQGEKIVLAAKIQQPENMSIDHARAKSFGSFTPRNIKRGPEQKSSQSPRHFC